MENVELLHPSGILGRYGKCPVAACQRRARRHEAERSRVSMYRFSRAIYRELAGDIIEDPHGACLQANHERVLRACEAAVERLATDRHYFAHPTRTLFCDVRAYFPMSAQARVLRVIERYLGCADEFLRRQPQNGFDVYGKPLQCRASTRRGNAMPTYAAAPQRLLPIPSASGRDRGDRSGAGGLRGGLLPERRPLITGNVRPCSWASTSAERSPTPCSHLTAGC